jgi:hypothetical protein
MSKSNQKKKVVVRFKGGLANQIYQLAAGSFLSQALDRTLVYSDIYYRVTENPRNLIAPSVYDEKLAAVRESAQELLIHRLIQKIPIIFREKIKPFIGRKIVISDDEFKKLLDNNQGNKKIELPHNKDKIILDGYFHFHSSLEESMVLRKLKILSTEEHKGMAIHVRLGDYLQRPYSSLYNTIDSRYISNAYQCLVDKGMAMQKQVYVFSDSPDLARDLVSAALPNAEIILAEEASELTHLKMLSSFKFMILSNSSYSLLAWHLSNQSTAVIPENWFKTMRTDPSQFSKSDRLTKIRLN